MKKISLVLGMMLLMGVAGLTACGGGSDSTGSSGNFDKDKFINELARVKLVSEYDSNVDFNQMGTVTFGTYPQNDATGNTKEPIEWLVLDKNSSEEKVLVISKYILDVQNYHNSNADVNWENCDLRKWMNNDFYNSAFNKNEKKRIIESQIANNPGSGQNPSIFYTNDKIFCLNHIIEGESEKGEAKKYFGNNSRWNSQPTIYANYKKSISTYWSRDGWHNIWYGGNSGYTFFSNKSRTGSEKTPTTQLGVRPMMWISYK